MVDPIDSATEAALDLMSILVLEDGRRWGEAATSFQWEDARANLAPMSPTPYQYQTRPRGGAKTADLAGVVLAVMLTQAPPGARLYTLAADRDQGALVIESILGYVSRTPALEGLLQVSSYKVTVIDSGVVLEVLAADANGAWGLRPYFVVIDEIAQWKETETTLRLFEAVRSSVVKMRARMVITTTAGDPAHFAYAIRQHALEDPLWRVHEVPGPVPWQDPALLAEQERALPASSYRRLMLNEWTETEDRLTTLDALQRCAVLDGPQPPNPGTEYVIGVDLGLTRDRSAVAIAHAIPADEASDGLDPIIVLDDLLVWEGTPNSPVSMQAVFKAVLAASEAYGSAKVILDPYQAEMLAERLQMCGVAVEMFTFTATSNARLAATLLRLLSTASLHLPNDPALIDELARVRIRETAPNVPRLDHDPGQHDDRAIAIALAAQELISNPPDAGPRIRYLGFNSPPRFGGGIRSQHW